MVQLKDIVNDSKVFNKVKVGFEKERKLLPKHYFIDETGKPEFFGSGGKLLVDTPGFSKLLMIGMVEVEDRNLFRNQIEQFQNNLKSYRKLSSLNYLQEEDWYLHASKDKPKVRMHFFKFLATPVLCGIFNIKL